MQFFPFYIISDIIFLPCDDSAYFILHLCCAWYISILHAAFNSLIYFRLV